MEDSSAVGVVLWAAAFAGLSAIAGVVSAFAAWRSAGAARKLADTEAEAEKRRLTLDLARLAQEVLSKAKSIDRLCDEINIQYTSLAVFTGGTGGSRHKLFTDRAEGYRTNAAEIVDTVQQVTAGYHSIEQIPEGRLGELLVTYTMKREEFVELVSMLAGEKAELQAQLAIFQEKAIKQ